MALRATFWVAAGVIVGFVLGGVPARRESKALRAQRDALKTQLAAATRPNLLRAFLPQVENKSPEREAQPTTVQRAPKAAVNAGTGGAPPPTARAAVAGETSATPAPIERSKKRSPLLEFEEFVTAQRVRTAAARAALEEQAHLDASQIALIDQSIERMNAKLLGYGDEIISQLESEEMPSPAQMLGLGHDVSGIMYEAQRELDATVGKAATRVDKSALQIWTYVDVEQWRPIVTEKLSALGRHNATGAAGSTAAPRE